MILQIPLTGSVHWKKSVASEGFMRRIQTSGGGSCLRLAANIVKIDMLQSI